ncbi:MAG TPA: glycosyltransferase [Solirubrobacteraceae bacterium]
MTLTVELERALPRVLPADSPTVVYCTGSCWHDEREIVGLDVLVDGIPRAVTAFGMPRPDLGSVAGMPEPASHGGFWALITVPGRGAPGSLELDLRARLRDGSVAVCALARVEISPRPPAPAGPATPADQELDTIAVCMATYEPDIALLTAQIDSLRRQTDHGWICLISDDGSSPGAWAKLTELIGDDPRFTVSRSPERRGFYRNFERALEMVPLRAGLVALCDQDDRWHPDKLASLRAGLGEAMLAYSDMRLVGADGTVFRDTLWRGRANNHHSLVSVLVANTITGAACLFRRELLELALPFPDTPGFQFHDAWLAVVALAAGPVAYVDRALYDYVQHPGAVFGDVTHGQRGSEGGRIAAWWAQLRTDGGRAAYFYGYLARAAQAQAVLARCDHRLEAPKRRELERFLACDGSWLALAWLGLRPLRSLLGHTETLGSELGLAQGVLWKTLTARASRRPRLARGPLADAAVPPPQTFSQKRLRAWRSRL